MTALERYITPRFIMEPRFGDEVLPSWETAVLIFHGFTRSSQILSHFCTSPLRRRLLSGVTKEDLHVTSDMSCLVVTNIGARFGCGPTVAAIVEELAELGIKQVIGIGCAGSISPKCPRGTQFVVTRALITDGTSLHYGYKPLSHAEPHRDLLTCARTLLHYPHEPRDVTGAQIEAIYRETPRLASQWRELGAEVINLEISTFYAAASFCGVPAIYFGHVSDELLEDRWSPWTGEDRNSMVDRTASAVKALVHALSLR